MPYFGLGTGQESWLGIAEESTYGTRATPTEFVRFVSENVKHDTNILSDMATLGEPGRGSPIRSGVRIGGGIVIEPWITGIETFIKYMLGDHFTTTNPTTGVYNHKFRVGRYLPAWKSVADPSFTSLTMDVYRGGATAGYVWGYSGLLFDGMRLDFGPNSPGRISAGVKFYDSCIVQSPAATSATMNRLPIPTRFGVHLADPTTGTPTYTDVSALSFSLTVPHGIDQEFPLGLNGGVKYPLPMAPHRRENLIKVAGQFTCFVGVQTRTYGSTIGTFEQMQQNNSQAFMRITADAGETSLSQAIGHIIELQGIRITSAGPETGDPSNLKRTVTFEAFTPSGADVCSVQNQLQWTVANFRSSFGAR